MKTLLNMAIATIVLSSAVAMNAQAVNFWTGGVGIESRAEAPLFNTAFQFFQHDGSFLADISYTLYDANGQQMLQGMTEGPWLFVDLPNGQYSIKGVHTGSGETQSIRFSVQGDAQVLGLRYHQ
jgi:hypothetical protein